MIDDFHDFFADIELQSKNKKKYKPNLSEYDRKITIRNFGTHLLSKLSPREERVLRMLTGTGLNNSYNVNDIAQQLNISDFEVVTHANNGFRKFVVDYFKNIKVTKN
tara:strand:- start:1750 stop:2070 length:321 start_codon:yes stop_codon:yes gene_type:complete